MNQTGAAGRADTSSAIHQDGCRGGGKWQEVLGKLVFAPVPVSSAELFPPNKDMGSRYSNAFPLNLDYWLLGALEGVTGGHTQARARYMCKAPNVLIILERRGSPLRQPKKGRSCKGTLKQPVKPCVEVK